MRTEREPLVLNGSLGEGGGALLRTALALSSLTQIPVRLHHIRGGTRKPGLTSEDLTFIRMLEVTVNARLEGDDIGSSELVFVPKRLPRALHGEFDVRAHEKGSIPGNVFMIAESLWPVLSRAGAYSTFRIKGETYNNHTLTFDAFTGTTLPLHAKQGVVGFATQNVAGFGFAGLGEVDFEVEPSSPQGFEWVKRGELLEIRAIVAHHGVAKDVPERALETLRKELKGLDCSIDLDEVPVDSREAGVHVSVMARYERGLGGGSGMGAKGVRIETVCGQALQNLREFTESESTLDPYLADQALMLAAMAQEPTRFSTPRLTLRLQTMASTIRQFIPVPITILGRIDEPATVQIGG